jgi:hypothetical protein
MKRFFILVAAIAVSAATAQAQFVGYDAITGAVLAFTSSQPRTYMGQAFDIADPGAPPQITSMHLVMVTAAAVNYPNTRIRVQFWDTYNGASSPVFAVPDGGVQTFETGPFSSTGPSGWEFTLNFPTPISLTGLTGHGISVNWQSDPTGTSTFADDPNLTAALRTTGSANINPGVNENPGSGYYRNASGETDLNFASGDARSLSGVTNGGLAFDLTLVAGTGSQPPVANAQSITVLENTSAAITLTGSDPNNNPLTYSIVTSPTNGTLSGSAPDVIYQPNTGYLGHDSFTFTVNNGVTDSVPAQVSITVAAGAGLIITPIFDSTITSDPNAATIENTINQAILAYETRFSDPVNVTITFQEVNSGLGASSTYGSTISYSSYYNALTADSKTSNDAVALAHTPGGPNNPVDGTTSIRVTTANQRALGFNTTPPPGQTDSTIFLNVSLMNLDRQTIDPSKYDLMAVVSHEIDEALGTASGLSFANIEPVDLFRYTSGGLRTYTTSGDNAWFSINGGTTDLARYNQDPGGDYGDWWSIGSHTPQVQDAFGTPAVTPNLGVELTVLDVIGYDYIVAALPPRVQSVARSGNNIVLTWNSMAGRTYQVQYTASVSPTSWNNLGSPVAATGPTTSISDPILPNGRFYRVVMLYPAVANGPRNHVPEGAGPLTLSNHYLWPVRGTSHTARFIPVMTAPANEARVSPGH